MIYSKIELAQLIETPVSLDSPLFAPPNQEAVLTKKGGANLMMRIDKLVELDNVDERIVAIKAIISSVNQIKNTKGD